MTRSRDKFHQSLTSLVTIGIPTRKLFELFSSDSQALFVCIRDSRSTRSAHSKPPPETKKKTSINKGYLQATPLAISPPRHTTSPHTTPSRSKRPPNSPLHMHPPKPSNQFLNRLWASTSQPCGRSLVCPAGELSSSHLSTKQLRNRTPRHVQSARVNTPVWAAKVFRKSSHAAR
jgi:hypothetical protein